METRTTLELIKLLPRHKYPIGGKVMTLRQHWFSTEDKNYRYKVRTIALRLLKLI